MKRILVMCAIILVVFTGCFAPTVETDQPVETAVAMALLFDCDQVAKEIANEYAFRTTLTGKGPESLVGSDVTLNIDGVDQQALASRFYIFNDLLRAEFNTRLPAAGTYNFNTAVDGQTIEGSFDVNDQNCAPADTSAIALPETDTSVDTTATDAAVSEPKLQLRVSSGVTHGTDPQITFSTDYLSRYRLRGLLQYNDEPLSGAEVTGTSSGPGVSTEPGMSYYGFRTVSDSRGIFEVDIPLVSYGEVSTKIDDIRIGTQSYLNMGGFSLGVEPIEFTVGADDRELEDELMILVKPSIVYDIEEYEE